MVVWEDGGVNHPAASSGVVHFFGFGKADKRLIKPL
jgi:hypothetical protein